jgi:translation initiation factor 1 (eIF-1/SUI1)
MVLDVKKTGEISLTRMNSKARKVQLNLQGMNAFEIHSDLVAALKTKILCYGAISCDL